MCRPSLIDQIAASRATIIGRVVDCCQSDNGTRATAMAAAPTANDQIASTQPDLPLRMAIAQATDMTRDRQMPTPINRIANVTSWPCTITAISRVRYASAWRQVSATDESLPRKQ